MLSIILMFPVFCDFYVLKASVLVKMKSVLFVHIVFHVVSKVLYALFIFERDVYC